MQNGNKENTEYTNQTATWIPPQFGFNDFSCSSKQFLFLRLCDRLIYLNY